MSKDIKKQLELWEKETYRPAVEKRPERRETFTTISGQEVKPLYTPADVEGLDYGSDLGFPGEFPYTRGTEANGYTGNTETSQDWPNRYI